MGSSGASKGQEPPPWIPPLLGSSPSTLESLGVPTVPRASVGSSKAYRRGSLTGLGELPPSGIALLEGRAGLQTASCETDLALEMIDLRPHLVDAPCILLGQVLQPFNQLRGVESQQGVLRGGRNIAEMPEGTSRGIVVVGGYNHGRASGDGIR